MPKPTAHILHPPQNHLLGHPHDHPHTLLHHWNNALLLLQQMPSDLDTR